MSNPQELTRTPLQYWNRRGRLALEVEPRLDDAMALEMTRLESQVARWLEFKDDLLDEPEEEQQIVKAADVVDTRVDAVRCVKTTKPWRDICKDVGGRTAVLQSCGPRH